MQRVRFRIEFFTTCQILGVLLLQFAKFLCVRQRKARFGKAFLYGVDSVSQVLLLR